MIPDYDRKMASQSKTFPPYIFHEDRFVSSRLFDNVLISFRWRFHIKEDLVDDFTRWAFVNDSKRMVPDFILLGLFVFLCYTVRWKINRQLMYSSGVTAHHIRTNQQVTRDLEQYKEALEKKLLPLLQRNLAVHPKQEIIWLHQSPTIDYLGPGADSAVHEITAEKIINYNRNIRQILR